ncbi:hypothetical protein [Azospirillum sp. TSO5]|uniref:hypothetical protein n=1 Tax=Azospirillum sp. TSO5 TaxID=716760 RepID=UPI000D647775|nr:hypothetical protein [Azospirillum sp. TSO5]
MTDVICRDCRFYKPVAAEDRWRSPGTEGRCGIQLPPMLASLTWGKHNSNVITNENTGCSLGEKEAA